MSLLDRYKKAGGFVQLLTLLETCGQAKREKFLQMILEENALWHDALKQRLLSLEKVLTWPQEYITEISSRALPITLAAISKATTEEQSQKLLAGLPHSSFSKIREVLENKTFSPAETTSSIEKFLGETRGCIQQGIVKLEKFAPELVTPDDIEDQLSKRLTGMPSLPPPEIFNEKATLSSRTSGTSSGSMGTVTLVNTNHSSSHASNLGTPTNSDELANLRRQNIQLQQEVQHLRQENHVLKDKLEKIRRIA
jgi:hypothetical protein